MTSVSENIMKRVLSCSVAIIVVMIAAGAIARAQSQTPSLGDYARAVKKKRPQDTKGTPKVYDNDNLPSGQPLSVVGPSPETSTGKDGKDTDAKTANKATDPNSKAGDKADQKKNASADDKAGQPPEKKEKAVDTKKDMEEQQKKVEQLTQELDKVQQDYNARAVKLWADNEQYTRDVAEKQKALDEAKSKLNDLQDGQHDAGTPIR
jgi:hypothetical protein